MITNETINYKNIKEVLSPADVLLVVSPLAVLNIPLLGIHLLQASCRDMGISTGVLYSNLLYSKLLGTELHNKISSDILLVLGERLFASAAFRHPAVSIKQSMDKFFDPGWVPDHAWQTSVHPGGSPVPEPVVYFREWLGKLNLEHLETLTTEWIHALARQIVDIGFPIVGCSTTFGGLIPSIALLDSIKKLNPAVVTIIGGALCEAEMAEGILSLKTDIDYVFSGEGETVFPGLVDQIIKGRLPEEKIIYGEKIIDLDSLPIPDYRDFLNQKQEFHPPESGKEHKYCLSFETSRGCWYGKCTFCGLNGKKNLFRCKSPGKVIKSLKSLVETHGVNIVIMTDNMMPFKYFDTLIPHLPNKIPSTTIIYETRADLTLDQVSALKKAGITFRPGIESLSSSLLRCIKKPYTVRGNISLLRYARSCGMDVNWALLFGFPGDQIEGYEEMLRLFPLIRHLQPPSEMLPLALFRFSKYHKSPGQFDLSKMRPAEIFRDTFPPYADLDKIAYYFTADYPSQSRENPGVISRLWKEYRAWRKAWNSYETLHIDMFLPSLNVSRINSGLYLLTDTRGLPGLPGRMELDEEKAKLLLVSRPLEVDPGVDVQWAVNAKLGVKRESWFISLATADPALLREFQLNNQ